MKKQLNKIVLAAAIGLVLLFLFSILSNYAPVPVISVSNEGFVKVNVQLDGSALRFSSDCYTVTMNIHELQALSIKNGIENRIDVRPLTHDMMREVMDNFGIRVVEVRIVSFENDIYRATTFIQQGSRLLDIDTRPSDAVGMAVRTNAPVYFSRQMLESNGVNTCK